ncbi:type I restriction modification DNA specificity domain protein [Staphylococcus aureus]|uniref:restriction endonuclease subunit S n=1 Tax=Staphylococcus aureus TaxID=1280 RepID=UPI000910B334|nr:restriction endonuclease subunit S [Staphylococcus aureus]SGV90081.1 type I restriction modification DNA specificity domain protein [Staphylococcus aureus]
MSNTQKKNVPELRFPGFEGEWEEKKLGENAIIKGRLGWKGLKQSEYLEKGYAYLIANKHINSGHINWEKADQISRYRYEESPEIALEKGDLIFSKDGALGNPALINNLTKPATINSTMMLVRLDQKNFSSIFFYQILLGPLFNKLIYLKVSGSSIPHLFQADMKEFKFNAPPLIEQQKIGKFFSKLDRQIELEEQKLELLQQKKKGYMQKIFSQELRFKDENGNDYPEWEKKKLKEIAYVYTGNTPSKKENIYWIKGEYVWVTPTDINNSKNIYESEHKLTQEGYKKARQLPENTLLVTCIASIGKNAILRKQGSCNQQINAVVPFENINIDYLYYISDSLSTFMKSIAGKTATQIVNKNTFENLEIYLASFEEQNKIAGLISSLEELIEKQASKLIKMKSRKQGMLQIMFI